jgi:hypothetical protein
MAGEGGSHVTHVDPVASRRRVVRVYDRAARIYDV